MLQYLVTSKARRRLLALLWAENARGSVADLAKRADVAFASAHSELREMLRLQLACSEQANGREVLSANSNHPDADVLRALVASEVARSLPLSDDDVLAKRQLVGLGAPLRDVEAVTVPDAERIGVLAKGMLLARRDPVVARVVTLCLWPMRDSLTARDLVDVLPTPADRHVAGFFLELTSVLGNDRRLLGVAENLRDRRFTAVHPFFRVPTTSRHPLMRSFPLAEKWGFEMNLDLEAFHSLFDKFVKR